MGDIYRIRVILDTEENAFRDLEIHKDASLEDLHHLIVKSFGFEGQEMASFYKANDEWEQGEEIPLIAMESGTMSMETVFLAEVMKTLKSKLIYVYDYLSMWTFFVELMGISEIEKEKKYPLVLFSNGDLPESLPEKTFISKKIEDEFEDFSDFNEEFDDENGNYLDQY